MKKAKWIWKHNENKVNTWMCFVKEFTCEETPDRVTAQIAVDSKYWLYINGEMVVFEGGLKRGPSPDATYFDELDLTGCLVQGLNRIAVLVWYFGKSGFSHVSSGRGGLCFEAAFGNKIIYSDETWRVKKNEAYIPMPEGELCPNFRLPESDIYYDASLELGQWYQKSYSVEAWEHADVLDIGDETPFGSLVKRDIPQFRNYGIKDFVNSHCVNGMFTEESMTVEMKLPYNLQFTPVMILDAPKGKRIKIMAENYRAYMPVATGIKSVYITKDGLQEYEALGWLNGEHISFEIPAGVKILGLKYRETGYDTDRAGSFRCDDEELNRLWEKCYRTLYLSMRDTFMDCPDRERTQWWGDVNIEMQMLLYCMDEKAALLYKKGVDSLIGWYEATGNMLTVVPSGIEQFELPFQNLAGIYGFYLYYFHIGDTEFARKVYPMARSYVLRYIIAEDNLVVHREGSWDWPDWGEHADIVIMENSWYHIAVSSCMKLAKALGFEEDIREYQRRLGLIQKGMQKKVNNEGVFYDFTDNGCPDDRANALAVLAGFVPAHMSRALAGVLATVENASPYMEKYVLDALCEIGLVEEAVERMKRRYAAMVKDDYSTLWELWSKEASLNHAWSGGPLVTMSKYIAGISVAEEGGLKYRISPHPGRLRYIECDVPTRFGCLSVQITRENGSNRMNICHPKEITVIVEAPVVAETGEDKNIWNISLKSM